MISTTPDANQPTAGTNRQTAPPDISREMSLAQIVSNPLQPRRNFDDAAMEELTQAIRRLGVLQPIIVWKLAAGLYEIVAGERRFRAAKRAGLTTIPVIIQDFDEQERKEVALIENLQRDDLSPVETARAFRALKKEFGMTQQQIAERVGKSKRMVLYLQRLLQLPDEILDSLDRDEVQEGHARALLLIKDPALQKRLWQQILAEGLSVREIEKRARAERNATSQGQDAVSPSSASEEAGVFAERYEQALEKRLSKQCGTEVMIQHTAPEEGFIEIAFYSNPDLVRIMDVLLDAPA